MPRKANKAAPSQWVFRDQKRTQKLNANGLQLLQPSLRAEFQAHCEYLARKNKLLEQALQPIGQLLDQPSTRRALRELQELENQSRQPMGGRQQFAPSFVLRPRPFQINTQPGANSVTPPLDDEWTDQTGFVYASADKTSGLVNTTLAASGDHSNEYAAAGVLLWIVPQSASNTLLLLPFVKVHYNWNVETELGPTAHSRGSLNYLIKAHDGQGAVIDNLTIDNRQQLWSAGSSGVSDSQSGHDDFESSPYFVLRGGTYYEAWFWVQNYADAGSNFFGGWSRADAQVWAVVERVDVAQV
jgi:hypothetical protein